MNSFWRPFPACRRVREIAAVECDRLDEALVIIQRLDAFHDEHQIVEAGRLRGDGRLRGLNNLTISKVFSSKVGDRLDEPCDRVRKDRQSITSIERRTGDDLCSLRRASCREELLRIGGCDAYRLWRAFPLRYAALMHDLVVARSMLLSALFLRARDASRAIDRRGVQVCDALHSIRLFPHGAAQIVVFISSMMSIRPPIPRLHDSFAAVEARVSA